MVYWWQVWVLSAFGAGFACGWTLSAVINLRPQRIRDVLRLVGWLAIGGGCLAWGLWRLHVLGVIP
jgi:hypothetical protein